MLWVINHSDHILIQKLCDRVQRLPPLNPVRLRTAVKHRMVVEWYGVGMGSPAESRVTCIITFGHRYTKSIRNFVCFFSQVHFSRTLCKILAKVVALSFITVLVLFLVEKKKPFFIEFEMLYGGVMLYAMVTIYGTAALLVSHCLEGNVCDVRGYETMVSVDFISVGR